MLYKFDLERLEPGVKVSEIISTGDYEYEFTSNAIKVIPSTNKDAPNFISIIGVSIGTFYLRGRSPDDIVVVGLK